MTRLLARGPALLVAGPALMVAGLVLAAATAACDSTLPDPGALAEATASEGVPLAGEGGEPATDPQTDLPSHETFTRVLEEVVRMPRVDYALLQERRELLDAYLAELGRTTPATLEAAPRSHRLAFWINAYNACMVRLVVDHYPIEAGGVGLFGFLRNRVAGYPDNSVWQIRDVFTRDHCVVAGAARSQDEIEHEIIRPRFGEPRIHFAVNCAAVSCPVLWSEAYTGDRLDEQLDRAVMYFMDTPEHFALDRGTPATLRLNKVLDWYAEDFGGTEGLKRFFVPYLSDEDARIVARPDTRVVFEDYDWTLNDVPR